MGDDAREDGDLGYPLRIPDLPKTGNELWGMSIIVGYTDAGLKKLVPIAYTPEQAREIARRITEWYGP